MDQATNRLNEFRAFGPPGTGKTTWLQNQIERAVEKYGPDTIMVASFTRAAAFELNSRKLPIPRDMVGTLHALCYRGLGSPEICEMHADEFNAEYPHYAISKHGKDIDSLLVDAHFDNIGDALLATMNIYRAKMIPVDMWPVSVRGFWTAWMKFKIKTNYIDFTDMIEYAITGKEPPPNNAAIGFYDEVQDFNPLELKLIRTWAKKQEFVVLTGDDDQAIYTFSGASPQAFLYPPLPASQKTVLKYSWRLPRVIQEFSQKWIRQVKNREPKEFQPRDAEGTIAMLNATIASPMRAIDLAVKEIQHGRSVMFLATCGYMLNTLKTELRKHGLPFWNPYRKTRGDWNPLGSFDHRSNKTATKDRFLAFLSSDIEWQGKKLWNPDTLYQWISLIRVRDIMQPKAKKYIDDTKDHFGPDLFPCDPIAFYDHVFLPDALHQAIKRDPKWFRDSMLASKMDSFKYPYAVFKTHGKKALEERPLIQIGTIHSVKGGECDTVILFPDLSPSAMKEYNRTGEDHDSIIRTLYVGMTRARENLYLCKSASNLTARGLAI